MQLKEKRAGWCTGARACELTLSCEQLHTEGLSTGMQLFCLCVCVCVCRRTHPLTVCKVLAPEAQHRAADPPDATGQQHLPLITLTTCR